MQQQINTRTEAILPYKTKKDLSLQNPKQKTETKPATYNVNAAQPLKLENANLSAQNRPGPAGVYSGAPYFPWNGLTGPTQQTQFQNNVVNMFTPQVDQGVDNVYYTDDSKKTTAADINVDKNAAATEATDDIVAPGKEADGGIMSPKGDDTAVLGNDDDLKKLDFFC